LKLGFAGTTRSALSFGALSVPFLAAAAAAAAATSASQINRQSLECGKLLHGCETQTLSGQVKALPSHALQLLLLQISAGKTWNKVLTALSGSHRCAAAWLGA